MTHALDGATPAPDVDPLYSLAAQLELRAATLAQRGAVVTAVPASMRWSGPGARAFADRAVDVAGSVRASAAALDDLADQVRRWAAQLSGGR